MYKSAKVVVVTGCSSGFGEGAVKAFADKGYRVWGTMRDAEGRNSAKKAALEAYSSSISVIEMDVAEDVSVATGFSRILNEGSVDILINNAGIMFLGITEAFSVAQAHEQMNSNYYGAIRTMQAVLPAMRKAGTGLIINCSSLVGRIAPPFFGTYTATKHALEGYSQSLRYEVARFGVDIAIVEPGPFGTGLLGAGKPPALGDVLASYGELAGVPIAMGEEFAQMLQSEGAPDPQLVVDAYLALAEMPAGKRPTRTVAGITWGVDEINALTQPIQDAVLKEMHLESVLGGASVQVVAQAYRLPDQSAAMVSFAPDYKQHNPKAADGLQGYIAAMPIEQWVFTKQHKVLGEGNFALSISEGTHKGVHSAFQDLVRVENGIIVEHWDVIQAIPTANLANSNGMFNF